LPFNHFGQRVWDSTFTEQFNICCSIFTGTVGVSKPRAASNILNLSLI